MALGAVEVVVDRGSSRSCAAFQQRDVAARPAFPHASGLDATQSTSMVDVNLVCANDVLSVQFASATGEVMFDVPVDGTAKRWTFDARVTMDATRNRFGPLCVLRWYARAPMLDVMYDAPFDGADPLVGRFSVEVDEDFLTSKYGWVTPQGGASPPSDMTAMISKNKELKRRSGTCPLLSRAHQRSRDLIPEAHGPDVLQPMLKRQEWLDRYAASEAVNGSFGTLDLTQSDYVAPLLWYHLQEKEDEIALGRNGMMGMGEFDPILLKYQLHCLAPNYQYYIGYVGTHGYAHWKYSEAIAYAQDSTRVRKKAPVARFVAPTTKHLFTYTGSDASRAASRQLFYDMLPPRNGFPMPRLSSKFLPKLADGGAATAAMNLTYVPEMVYALTIGWMAGETLPDDLARDLAAYWRKCTSLRTYAVPRLTTRTRARILKRSCAASRPCSTATLHPSDPAAWRPCSIARPCTLVGLTCVCSPVANSFESIAGFANFFHSPRDSPCNTAISPATIGRFAAFLGGSPVWEIVRTRNTDFGLKYNDLWGDPRVFAEALIQEMQGLVNSNQYITEFLLQNEEAQQMFRADPDKAILELLRMGLGTSQLTEPTTPRSGEQSCPVRNPAGDFIGLNVPSAQDEMFVFGVANRDPARFSRPNTFDPQRPDWMHSMMFAAPLEIFYNTTLEGETGKLPPFDHAKPLRSRSKYFCLGAYAVIEVSKFIMSSILDAQAAAYREHRRACTDNVLEAERVYGPAMYPEAGSVCEHAVARTDAQFAVTGGVPPELRASISQLRPSPSAAAQSSRQPSIVPVHRCGLCCSTNHVLPDVCGDRS